GGDSTVGYDDAIGRACLGHVNGGGDGMGGVLGRSGGGLGDVSCARVVEEMWAAGGEAGPQKWVRALDETGVEGKDLILSRFGHEVCLQLFQLVRILRSDIVGFAEVLGDVVEFPGIFVKVCAAFGIPRQATVTADGDPAVFIECTVANHLEVLDM